MKKTGLLCASILVFFVCVTLLMDKMGGMNVKDVNIKLPEGYSEPENSQNDRYSSITRDYGIRVKKLEIDDNVHKYFEETIELVAFAPGSGWIKFKTRDGLSPTINFNKVTHREIKQFNSFSHESGRPVRARLDGSTLYLSAMETQNDLQYFATKAVNNPDWKPVRFKGFYKAKFQEEMVIKKNKNGNIFLVKAVEDKKSNDALAMIKNEAD